MAVRLGNVIYWLSLVIAVPGGAFALFMWWAYYLHSFPHEFNVALYLTGISGGSYLIGRIARYVLAGR